MKRVHQQLFYSFAFIFILLTFVSCGSGGSGGSGQTTQSGDNSNQPASNSTTGTTTPAANSGTGTPPASGNNSGSSTDPGPVATPVSTTPPAPNLNPPPDPPKGGGTSGGSTGNTEVAEWQLLGGQVNAAQRGTAVWLTLATFQNNPVVAWEEDGKIYAGFWSGSEWKVEGPLNANPNEAASLPSLAGDGQGLYLTWIEARSLYLVRREGNGWATVAVQSQQSGCAPANAGLDVRQGVPTLAWDSFCNESMYASTRVQQWAGAWVDLGGVGEHYADAPSPRKYALGSHDQNLSLAVLMQNAASPGIELALFHHTDQSWLPDGGPANDPLTFVPSAFSLAFIQSHPTLAFQQDGIQAKQWNGETWVALGAPLSSKGVDPALMEVNGNPMLAFGGPDVEVWGWNGAGWNQSGKALNQIPGSFSWSTSLATSGQQLYTAWIENGFVFVKSLAIH